ncbi:MAG TPA: hypothetical protein VMT35_17835 [Ignavibacteriaceae bacterium]|nr:hypothetical protein [Ignavibacteriaceae bacterium]
MRFRMSSFSYIGPGVTVRHSVWWSHPGDKGPIWLMAHPMKGEPSSEIITERVMKITNCEIGKITINGDAQFGCGDPDTAYWWYAADFTNDSSNGCRYQLEGGGF